ncbi:serine/threonine-protein phosphatase 7 long form homolog [Malania oleifera]|uniref:serine/threonine-protein phosphatase 7 long form homolog n=1 Tax=Malania oleifera TaxID=397392 RepID=UPI0025ADDDA0|nr:serine/threonine-protein phosphatase 7 long form homolog [Malania oleifera]
MGGGADQGGALCHMCKRLLGVVPAEGEIVGACIHMQFLKSKMFFQLPIAADGHTVACHAYAHLLHLICGTLFCDLSGSYAHLMFLPLFMEQAEIRQYSWGSTTLAWFYREMCHTVDVSHSLIRGALYLLQIWAWE